MEKTKIEQKFSEWYQMVCKQPTEERLEARFNSIYDYCNSEELDHLVLVQLFFELPVNDEGKETFINCIFENDKTFVVSNEREISCLAGMALYYLMCSNEKVLEEIILATLSIYSIKKDVIIPEVIEIVYKRFDEITAKSREENLNINSTKKTGYSTFDEAAYNTWNETTQKTLYAIIQKMNDNIQILGNSIDKLSKEVKLHKEDSNILSWIVAGYSNYTNAPLTTDTSAKEMAIVLGKELSELVVTPLGPFSAKGYLNKMLQLCAQDDAVYSLEEVVNAIPGELKSATMQEYKDIEIYMPICYAISESLRTGHAWIDVFAKINPTIKDMKQSLLDWSYQVYIEFLLYKLL